MKVGNFAPVAAVLAHPEAIVSGMTEAERSDFRNRYEGALHGDDIARRERLSLAMKQLETGWTTYMSTALNLRDAQAHDIEAAAHAADQAVNGAPTDLS